MKKKAPYENKLQKQVLIILVTLGLSFFSCSTDGDSTQNFQVATTFKFTHNWDGAPVTNSDFNTIQYTNENGEMLSIERLRYVISDITFTGAQGEILTFEAHNLVDVTNDNGLLYTLSTLVPIGNYSNVSFTFGLNNTYNTGNYPDLNAANFNVPDNLGGGYHYMQFDGKYLDTNSDEQGFNYHAIRAVDNPGPNPIFPQDTFFTVNLGPVAIANVTEIEVEADLAEWFKNPNTWDLNIYNQMLMPNSDAQIMMFENGQNVFSLGDVTQQ
ncbi:MbnP family protein [uncultured Winogradskyella sp.]|uniref:MbnP family protein n=1 Tax=uncultured Winogradskyella sp. TaxID=395353 RepID=UPI002609DB9A|nr:MbnP family protein [uncultured Winogradskyella sp.]